MVSKALYGVYPEGTMCAFTYASSNANVVEVNPTTGELKAKAVGNATITITSANSKKATASCEITVLPAPENVSFAQATFQIGRNNTYDLNKLMKVIPDNTCANYTFKSSNSKYVSVDANGVIKALRAGTVTITATSHNGKTATMKVQALNAPTKVTLKPTSLKLGVDMKYDLTVSFPSKTYNLYRFTSSDESVVSVDANGRLTAHKKGSATITVITDNNKTATCAVTVYDAPTFAEFLYEEYEVSEGMKLALEPVIDEGAYTNFTFVSSNPAVASVDANGTVSGHVAGTTKITVKTHNGVSNKYECTVVVKPAPAVLDYNGMPTVVISKGDKVAIPEPIALDASGNECPATYTFKSSSSSYAKISGNMVTGVKAGTVTITATSHNGRTATFKLKVVSEAITSLKLAYTDATLYTNDDYLEALYLYAEVAGANVNYGSVSYHSSNPNVAFVTEDGVVLGIAPGYAVITAVTNNGISATCNIRVEKLTTTLTFAQPQYSLTEGGTMQLTPVMDAGATAEITYKSSDTSIATVDENGVVTAVKNGDAVISAATQNGLTAETKLHVGAAPTGIYLNITGMNMYPGEEIVLKPELKANAAEFDASLRFESSNASVAEVDANGKIKAIAAGSAVITVTTCNGLTAKCNVQVLSEGVAARAEFAWDSATIVKGDTAKLEFTLNKDAYERGFTLTSSNPEALSVDTENWKITAKAAAPEGVTLTMTINGREGDVATLAEEVSCTVYVIEKSEVRFDPHELKLKTYNAANPQVSQGYAKITGLPENLIGTFNLYVDDEALVTYDPATGLVQALDQAGETHILCETYGLTAGCHITVDYLTTYRAVIVGEYNNSSETSSNLPFAAVNTSAMKTTLGNSYVDGRVYDQITYLPSNPSQGTIQSAISSTFADAKEGDVSLVYIVSHGYNGRADINNGGYFFGTPNWSSTKPDTIITSAELMSWLKPIEGNVVLVLDSCKSGGFIDDMSGQLSAEGNIAVLTAQSGNKNASFFVKSSGETIEFLTYAFCYGLGYDYENGIFMSAMAADSNGDKLVTVGEAISYARSKTSSLVAEKKQYFKAGSKTGFLVPGVTTTSKFNAWGGQTPNIYVPSAMNDVVIYGR